MLSRNFELKHHPAKESKSKELDDHHQEELISEMRLETIEEE